MEVAWLICVIDLCVYWRCIHALQYVLHHYLSCYNHGIGWLVCAGFVSRATVATIYMATQTSGVAVCHGELLAVRSHCLSLFVSWWFLLQLMWESQHWPIRVIHILWYVNLLSNLLAPIWHTLWTDHIVMMTPYQISNENYFVWCSTLIAHPVCPL